MAPRPGRIHKEYQLPFADLGVGADLREIKHHPDFGTTREDFVAFREERDATLAMPALILPSIQVNVRAGDLPEPEANGRSYLKIPINAFEKAR